MAALVFLSVDFGMLRVKLSASVSPWVTASPKSWGRSLTTRPISVPSGECTTKVLSKHMPPTQQVGPVIVASWLLSRSITLSVGENPPPKSGC